MKNHKVRLKRKLYNKLREIESVESSTTGHGDWSFTVTHKDGSEIYYGYNDSGGTMWMDLVLATGEGLNDHSFHGVAYIDTNNENTLIYDASHNDSLIDWDGHEVLSVKIREVLWNNIEPNIAQIEKDNSIKIAKDDYQCSMSEKTFRIGPENTEEFWLIDEEIEESIKSHIYDEFIKASWLRGINEIRIHDLSFNLDKDDFWLNSVVFFEKLIHDIEIVDDGNT